MIKTVKRHRYKDKKIFQTRTLTFEAYRFSELNMSLVMGLIQKNLTDDILKGKKSLMHSSDVGTVRYYGHCYHASQALYYFQAYTMYLFSYLLSDLWLTKFQVLRNKYL